MFKKFAALSIALTTLCSGFVPALAVADTPTTNLIPNSSFETSTNGTAPDGWQQNNYVANAGDDNQATFTYLNTGHTGSHSVEVQVASFKSGDDVWSYADVPVTAGTTYRFSDWYQSSVDTEVDAEVVVNGVSQYYKVGNVFASATWNNFTATFTAPAGATSMSLFHLIAATGYLITDDYNLTAYTPTAFNRPIVSVTFDDGWKNQIQNAVPVMTTNGLKGTYYIISDPSVTTPDPAYMNSTDVLSLYASGNEIGSHTVHHCDLTGLQTDDPTNCPTPISAQQVISEMQNSQTVLQNLIGAPVTDFAYPYGAYNASTIAVGKQYYQSQRTVNAGFNTKDNLDVTQLKMYEVDSNITTTQVQAWVDQAIAEKTWLILCYHEIATTPSDPSDGQYTIPPTDFATEMAYIKSTNVAVETVAQALAEVKPQVGLAGKPGDANGDGKINAVDLSILSSHWNTVTGATLAQGDFNGDGKVNAVDLSILSSNWGK